MGEPRLSRSIVPRFAAAGLLVWALAKHPYDYYVLLRWIVCAVATWTAVELHSRTAVLNLPTWLFAAAAILFNPVIPVHLDRGTWAYFNVSLAAAFIAVGFGNNSRRAVALAIRRHARVAAQVFLCAVLGLLIAGFVFWLRAKT